MVSTATPGDGVARASKFAVSKVSTGSGGGETATKLAGRYTPGQKLPGSCPIVTDNHLGLHDAALVDWKEGYGRYAAETTVGAIILAGDAAGFATWAKSEACRAEVAGVPDGRLFALIDGYIVSVSAQANTASATVSNGTGSIVWASGNYYVGEIKDGEKHGEGTYTDANGGTYVGQWKDDEMHGRGKATKASGEVHHDGEWVNGEPKE